MTCPDLAPCRFVGRLSWLQRAGPSATLDKSSSVVLRCYGLHGEASTPRFARGSLCRTAGDRSAEVEALATVDALDALEARLGPALEANRVGSAIDHVLIALPSYSVSESLMSHYGDRIPCLEHRYLGAILVPSRIPT